MKQNLLELAQRTAIDAGNKIKSNSVNILSEEGKDIKTKADFDAQEIIMAHLAKNSDYKIVSEEHSNNLDIKNEFVWYVDPLDGTMNYSRGFQISCVSIALWKGDEPILGVIYNFNNKDVYTGIVGEGAWINGSSISASTITSYSNAVLSTGFPVGFNYKQNNINDFVINIGKFKKIRMIGSAALSLAHVASGVFDAYTEENINIWDVAAGIAINNAAGGWTSYSFSEKNKSSMTVKAGYVFKDK